MRTTSLNETGIEMYGMKEMILASQGNNLVLTALQSTANILPASPEVKKALLDGSSIESFEDVLLNETVYLNEENFKIIDTCISSKEVQQMADKMNEQMIEMANETLEKCDEYFHEYAKEHSKKGFVWLKNHETGQFMVYTRAEYTNQIMDFLSTLK